MTELVQENLGQVQRQQKVWYDRNAQPRELKPGNEVLVLLPTSASLLFAQWQGPYRVEKMGKVDYIVNRLGKRKHKQMLHVNLLRKWHAPKDGSYFVEARVDWMARIRWG